MYVVVLLDVAELDIAVKGTDPMDGNGRSRKEGFVQWLEAWCTEFTTDGRQANPQIECSNLPWKGLKPGTWLLDSESPDLSLRVFTPMS